jgi:hypothetical protein
MTVLSLRTILELVAKLENDFGSEKQAEVRILQSRMQLSTYGAFMYVDLPY